VRTDAKVTFLSDFLDDPFGTGRHYRELLAQLPAALKPRNLRLDVRTIGRGGVPRRLLNAAVPGRGRWVSGLTGRPDLLHTTLAARPWNGAPRYVVSLHDTVALTFPDETPFPAWTEEMLRGAAAVMTVSRAAAAELTTAFGVTPERVCVIPGGVDTHRFVAGAGARDGVLFVGGRAQRKNLQTLLNAWPAVAAATGAALRVTGPPGPELDHVEWLGYVDDGALLTEYRRAAIVAVPSLAEGFGLPILEAMASGTPVIASDIAPFRELAREAALLLPALDPGAWEATLIQLLGDEDGRAALSAAGLTRAQQFSWAAAADALATMYERALATS
jgi:glycosyltransferase involved in cell wall biosynthesis